MYLEGGEFKIFLCDYLEQEPSGLLFVLNFKKNLIPVLLTLESLKEMEIVPIHSTT